MEYTLKGPNLYDDRDGLNPISTLPRHYRDLWETFDRPRVLYSNLYFSNAPAATTLSQSPKGGFSSIH